MTSNLGWCGDAVDPSSAVAPLSDCSFICPGNQYEYCGAGNRLELYSKSAPGGGGGSQTTPASTTTTSSTSATFSAPQQTQTSPIHVENPGGGYQLIGCYREPDGARALETLIPSDTMTIEYCLSQAGGATYAGVEYGRECKCSSTFPVMPLKMLERSMSLIFESVDSSWANHLLCVSRLLGWYGNTLHTGAVAQATYSECMMLCPGNSLEYCGGGNHLVLYQKTS